MTYWFNDSGTVGVSLIAIMTPLTQLLSHSRSHSLRLFSENFSQFLIKKKSPTRFVRQQTPPVTAACVVIPVAFGDLMAAQCLAGGAGQVPGWQQGGRATWQEGKPWSHWGCSHASHYCSTDGNVFSSSPLSPPPYFIISMQHEHICRLKIKDSNSVFPPILIYSIILSFI